MDGTTNAMSVPAINHAVPARNCKALHTASHFAPAHTGLHGSDANMQGLPCVGDESINGCIADDHGIGSVRIERVIRIRGDAHRNGGIGAPSRKACSDINLHNIARVEYAHAGNAMHHFIVHADAGRCRESRSTCSMRISKE